jgi:hypothetical protein
MNPHPARNPNIRSRVLVKMAVAVLAVSLVLTLMPTAEAGRSQCESPGMNTQCNELGTIAMPTQVEIRGQPVTLTTHATLYNNYMDMGARYIMFSIRHDAGAGSSPVSLDLKKFQTVYGPIFTERIDHDRPNEINLWAHVSDVPTNAEITLEYEVHATDRGAFRLETLVMPFDRGYEPLADAGGEDITMFSFSLVGVNKETSGPAGKKDFRDRLATPGPAPAVFVLALVAAALWVQRRKSA